LKIAFILNAFPALSETYILNQITGLLDLGHEVDIYASGKRDDPKVHAEFEGYNLSKRTYYPETPFIESLPDLRKNLLENVDCGQNSVTISRFLNLFKEYGKYALPLRTLPLLLKMFKNNSYDIIHCHFGPNGNLGGMLKQLGVIKGKVVTTFHGYDIRRGLEHGPTFYTPLREGVDCFLSISKYTRAHLKKFSLDPNKIVDHPVGIDLEKFPFRWDNENTPLVNKGPFKVLTVARLVREKGLEYGIRSIHQLLKKNPDLKIQYRIVGEGKLREDLNKMVAKLGLTNVVKFLGGKDQVGVSNEMLNAHIFLFPSLAEALPVALMEAQAIGLPVVASDVGGVAEIVADGKSGFLVSAQDVINLASKLEYLIKHPEIWPEMGTYGREIVEKRFDIKKLNKRLVKIYEALLTEDKKMLEEIKTY